MRKTRVRIPLAVRRAWLAVMDTSPGAVVALPPVPRSHAPHVRRDLRRALRVSTELDLFDDYTIAWRERSLPDGRVAFLLRKVPLEGGVIVTPDGTFEPIDTHTQNEEDTQ